MSGLITDRVVVASDHAGFELKKKVVDYLVEIGIKVQDLGSFEPGAVDYPDYGHRIAEEVGSGRYTYGISLCGSGNGINMTANKHREIRSALCWNKEIAKLARQHNDSNICALPARFISDEEARDIVYAFLTSVFEGGRHDVRKNKIPI